ncbi:tetratricopeptide repeat protein [Polaromonas sp. YR568]|uniref:tetratricopeptide repeat protein n=1 Tax=Polaromonas sp. YR568 TaxID=1855301 RepID=UPI00398C1255
MDFFDRADEYPDLREGLHEDAHAGQTTASTKSSNPTEAPGQRLLKWLTWGVIAVLLVYGLVLTTVHLLARVVGIPRAQIELAQLYSGEYWWHPADKAYAKELLREAVSAGNANAQYLLAYEYEMEKNYAQAFPLYQDLASRGFIDAQRRLGVLYVEGWGVSQSTAEGIKWLKTAAAQGDPLSHLALGFIYLRDKPNPPRDIAQAAQWIQSSAYLGNAQAQDTLAGLYATGEGVPKNLDLAMYWADKSRDAGHAPAQVTIQFIQSLKEGKK